MHPSHPETIVNNETRLSHMRTAAIFRIITRLNAPVVAHPSAPPARTSGTRPVPAIAPQESPWHAWHARVRIAILAVTVFNVPFRGSPLALLAIASSFLVPALGQGLFISAATRNQFVASQIALLTGFLPAMMLSGFLFEISSMPKWVQALPSIVPARWKGAWWRTTSR